MHFSCLVCRKLNKEEVCKDFGCEQNQNSSAQMEIRQHVLCVLHPQESILPVVVAYSCCFALKYDVGAWMSTYFRLYRGHHLSRRSVNVAQDTFEYTLLKNAAIYNQTTSRCDLSDGISMRHQCFSGAQWTGPLWYSRTTNKSIAVRRMKHSCSTTQLFTSHVEGRRKQREHRGHIYSHA